ncbi:penicillin binding protein PBP4B [Pseudidiomarina sp. 1APP75-27a]|uniref:penicillin binding protein PBP4B n=1 Tax=Pseudidiomarina terrestris TaxID=2820060 RepID=UPI002652E936|nr:MULTISPECIES: penicillin binding protein PBP4B [unclassified Pseudidiomarina]MDN7126115.1 penicillin binding protein PBP4B [Pseudidiomarina sp. 1APR75-33.1]MEA3588468.1 penicillin binding protein PBP4B [Pseudidiomarina sp. 1APP75-27a]
MIRTFIKPFSVALVALFTVNSCSSFADYEQMPSANYDHRIKVLVMHYTAIDYQKSVQVLVEPKGLSSHYLVPESGDPSYPHDELKVFQLVDESERAWHAGASYWQGRSDLNDQSIGIEIVNVPQCEWDTSTQPSRAEHGENRLCVFPDYDPAQIEKVIELAQDILERHPDIHPTAVVGHSDITPTRKNDPGPRFPWYQLYQHGVGAWYEQDTLSKYWKIFNQQPLNTGLLQAALHAYGYGLTETGVYDETTASTVAAFQMHFLPWLVNGKADSQTSAALFALLEKYFPEKLEQLWTRYQAELTAQPAPRWQPKHGQIDASFPEPEAQRSSRELVNDKAGFKSYRGRGELLLSAEQDLTAVLEVNGETLNIATPLRAGKTYDYSLHRRTQDGINTFHVKAVEPADATLEVRIPYPRLVDATADYQGRFDEVDELIEADIAKGFPGAVLVVVKDGKIIKQSAYGYARRYDEQGQLLAAPTPMQPDTLFDVASNTKAFATSMAMMQLVERGQLDVNKPIYFYLPEYRGDGREARTVKDLLNHHSGYAPQVHFFDPENKLGKGFYSLQKEKTQRLMATKVPFDVGNGVRATYSDTNFMLLGTIIERITGMPLDQYVEQNIYVPLGLHDTLFAPLRKGRRPGEIAATELQGNTRGGVVDFPGVRTYTLQGEVHDEKAFYAMDEVAGHAGLFATAPDLAVLVQTLLNGGGYGDVHLFEASVLDAFTKPHQQQRTFGLGWRRAADGQLRWHFGPYASHQAFGHTGWTGTATVVDPALDLGIILLTNARHSPTTEVDGAVEFLGKSFETGNYGSLMTAVYEAILEAK